MEYSAKTEWTKFYTANSDMAYPAEGVIRILKGSFPTLAMPKPTSGTILDLGCGDGRHFPLFEQIGLLGYGTEISEEICTTLTQKLKDRHIKFGNIQTGACDNLPFAKEYFDYLLSWNSCYYMNASKALNFAKHINEMARVIKKGGWLICSIPKKTCFIYQDSQVAEVPGFRVIASDPWGTRQGEIMKCFESTEEIETEFGETFTNFCHADIDMQWFGLAYHWHVFVARKR